MIYSYEECEKILDSFSNSILKEKEPIGYTSLEKLPIRHFTLGIGNNHIVVTGTQHSNEVITTSFVIELMKYIKENNIYFDDLTIHFIPLLNPEGYIINTSAINEKTKNITTLEYLIKFYHDYYTKYKIDTIDEKEKIKLHQKIFEDIDYKCIDNYYKILKDSTAEILSNHPKGSIIDWASNGNGIDLNSNSINKKVHTGEYNKQNAYNNIRIDIPSPIGYPGKNNTEKFKEEIEISALRNLFEELNKNNNLLGYLNYHSIGGLIYQRPENFNLFQITYNYLLSKFYQEYTIKNNNKYDIITNPANIITSVNDNFRIKYNGNLLIELSPMMGNPIGIYGDIKNYYTTINSNIKSFIYTMNNIKQIYITAKQITNQNILLDNIYPTVDKEYNLIKRKILTK